MASKKTLNLVTSAEVQTLQEQAVIAYNKAEASGRQSLQDAIKAGEELYKKREQYRKDKEELRQRNEGKKQEDREIHVDSWCAWQERNGLKRGNVGRYITVYRKSLKDDLSGMTSFDHFNPYPSRTEYADNDPIAIGTLYEYPKDERIINLYDFVDDDTSDHGGILRKGTVVKVVKTEDNYTWPQYICRIMNGKHAGYHVHLDYRDIKNLKEVDTIPEDIPPESKKKDDNQDRKEATKKLLDRQVTPELPDHETPRLEGGMKEWLGAKKEYYVTIRTLIQAENDDDARRIVDLFSVFLGDIPLTQEQLEFELEDTEDTDDELEDTDDELEDTDDELEDEQEDKELEDTGDELFSSDTIGIITNSKGEIERYIK
jgi:hypothetical protein